LAIAATVESHKTDVKKKDWNKQTRTGERSDITPGHRVTGREGKESRQ